MGDITPDILMHAYAVGVFPMSEHRDDPDIYWVDPKDRGIFPLDGFHISRSLAKAIRKSDYTVTLNHAFEDVIDGCAARKDTWINQEIRSLYIALHNSGKAHSLEVWREDKLIGGVYGVTLGAAFFGESMFSNATNGSKIALAYLTKHLKTCGFSLFDTQFLTDHLESLGAIEIPRAVYRSRLREAVQAKADITAYSLPDASAVIQRKTQMS